MTIPLKLRRGFSFDEAILMGQLAKLAYEIFPYDDGSIDDTELKEIYNSMHRKQGWRFIHSIRNDETNIRGFILKRTGSNQYAVSFRGSILTDRGAVELTDILVSDINWNFVKYGSMTDARIQVAKGFFEAFESVSDRIKIFFKTLLNQLTLKDFEKLEKLTPEQQFGCAMAMVDAGAIRLGTGFEQEARALIDKVVVDGEIDNNEELALVLDFKKKTLLGIEASAAPVEVYVTGHSLGGGLANLCALALRRCFGSDSDLVTKVYTFGGVKVGNQHFVNYYNEHVGEGMSYRVENLLDPGPHLPLPPPFPFNVLAPRGLRIGGFYMGNYASVGEQHSLFGIGSQSVSVSFGSALEFLGGIPFPHSYDTYIQLLKEEQQRWEQLSQPMKNVLAPFIEELLQEQLAQLIARYQASSQTMREQILQEINSLKLQQAIAQSNGGEEELTSKESAN
jgi:hypothetical protein